MQYKCGKSDKELTLDIIFFVEKMPMKILDTNVTNVKKN